MRQLLALLGDSFRQAMDRKILLVLLFVALIPILFCFGLSFESQPIDEQIRAQAQDIHRFFYRGGLSMMSVSNGVEFTVGEVRPVDSDGGWPPDLQGGYAFDLTFSRLESIDELVRSWRAFQKRIVPGGGPPRPPPEEPEDPRAGLVAPDERIEFLEDRFRFMGFHPVHAIADETAPDSKDADTVRFRVAVAVENPLELPGAHTIHMLFGIIDAPLENLSVAELVLQIELGLSQFFVGFVVMLIAISTTSGFVPDMLQKGTLDLVLARPIGRARLLLFKYLGGLWFIAIFATFLIGGCWVGLALRTGFTSPWFLFSIVPLLAVFAVLYSVSILVGVLTRSASISSLVALGTWGASSVLVSIRHSMNQAPFGADVPEALKTALEIAYIVLPKTTDLGVLNTTVLARAQLSSETFGRRLSESVPEVDWLLSLGSTAIFTAAMLALAVWLFRRRDY